MTSSEEPSAKRRRTAAINSGKSVHTAVQGDLEPSIFTKGEAEIAEDPNAGSRGKSPAEVKPDVMMEDAAAGAAEKVDAGSDGAVKDEPAEEGKVVATESPLFVAPTGAYTQREQFFQQQEASGAVTFHYICNDSVGHHSMWLIALKNIFSKQLPNMPKEYIARLVMDRRHRSVAIVRQDGSVVGGITYRPFHLQGFGEIAFCAVSASDQVKGFGSRLMSHTKEFAKTEDKLTHFLTYADNNAVGYFAKQGFTTEVTLDRERWVGYIKDYDGGTLMEGILHKELPYTGFPQMIHAQRAALDARIRGLSRAHLVYPGLKHVFALGTPALDPADIPGVKEAGWTREGQEPLAYRLLTETGEAAPTRGALTQFMRAALGSLSTHEDAWPFQEPVGADEVPDYYDIIKDPMDLSMVEQRLEAGFYITLEIFQADVRRIFSNARIYNAADTIYAKLANKLEAYFDHYLASHLVFTH